MEFNRVRNRELETQEEYLEGLKELREQLEKLHQQNRNGPKVNLWPIPTPPAVNQNSDNDLHRE